MSAANPVRGEAAIRVHGEALVVRPSFGALVAAEGELGPLFRLAERAADGELGLAEMVALLWHCLRDPPAGLTRDQLGEAVVAQGLAAAAPAVTAVLRQVLAGR